ncbi:MAG: sigma-70 family RNA polymerase sigma factor [Acidobacteria bacterium]|nr:sigma-70 family RNA polymerase sigma factor [Acidobacteriota bacterium]
MQAIPNGPSDNDVTRLLQQWGNGDRESLDRIMSFLYADLRRMAAKTGANPDDTMQATVIVNEFYLRILGQPKPKYENRQHFFSLAARVMRQIRIDHARREHAQKRGGEKPTPLSGLAEAAAAPVIGLGQSSAEDLHDALTHLESFDSRKASMLDLRYFAGFTVQEVASAFEVSSETVRRDMRVAEAWLLHYLDSR